MTQKVHKSLHHITCFRSYAAIRDSDDSTKSLNPYEQFKLIEPGPNENFERFIGRTETRLKELQIVPSDNQELATRMIKEQFIAGAKIPPWITQYLEPIDDLKKVASVAESLMRNHGVMDTNFMATQSSRHTWAPRPRPSIDQSKQQPRGRPGEYWQSAQPQWGNANTAPQNFHQPIRSQTGFEFEKWPNFSTGNQQPQYGDCLAYQPCANPHTLKCFTNQTMTIEQEGTEHEQMDPQAPSFGPYNGAWPRENKPV